jgi:hypothetical protein
MMHEGRYLVCGVKAATTGVSLINNRLSDFTGFDYNLGPCAQTEETSYAFPPG